MKMNLSFNHKVLIATAFFYLTAAVFSSGHFHFDEHFQILEFLGYKLGITPREHLAWEYSYQLRPWLQPFIYFHITKAIQFFAINSPFVWATFFRIFSALLAILANYQLFLYAQKKNIRFACLIPFIWFLPMLSARISGEAISASLTTLIIIYYLNQEDYSKFLFLNYLVPIIIGLNFHLRFQTAFIFVGFALYALAIKRKRVSDLILWSILIFLGIGLGLLADYWGYQKFSVPAYNYFYQNIVNDIASQFGTSPWWHYLVLTTKEATPFLGIPLIIGFFTFAFKHPKHLLTWTTVPFVVIHSLISHKELRFLFPIAPLAIFMAFNVLSEFYETFPRFIKRVGSFLIAINFILMIQIILRPIESSVSFYQYVYSNNQITTIHYLNNHNPFMTAELNIDYYKKPNLQLIAIDSYELLENIIETHKNIFLFAFDYHEYIKLAANKKCRSLYQSKPSWLYEIGILKKQLQRSRNWSIFQCSLSG